MNSVFLSGRLEKPIQVMSAENAPLHIITAIKVTHYNTAGVRKDDVFTLSAWRGTAKRFMEQARVGSNIVLEGYLSTQPSKDSPIMEVTVTEFRISNRELGAKAVSKPEAEDNTNQRIDIELTNEQSLEMNTKT